MPYVIFEVKSENAGQINEIIKDDLVSRQSILTRDASSLDIKGDVLYLKVEGSIEGIKRTKELAKDKNFKLLDDKKAEEVDEKIKQQEESAASGMGMIFD